MTAVENQFLDLLRSGLWATDPDPKLYALGIDWEAIWKIAKEQTVTGLVADGMTRLFNTGGLSSAMMPSDRLRMTIISTVLQTQARNRLLDEKAARIMSALRDRGIAALLVKGQGVAQHYIDPSHRSSGDIDILLSPANYHKAKALFDPSGNNAAKEGTANLHYEVDFEGVDLELHGSVRGGISHRMNRLLDEWFERHVDDGSTRIWQSQFGAVEVPSCDFDAIYIFFHFFNHFLSEGQGLRQICDWARLLYDCHGSIDTVALQSDIKSLGLERGWRVFACLIVDILGCPPDVVPLYDPKYYPKALQALRCCFITGNFGHRQESLRQKSLARKRKTNTSDIAGDVKGYGRETFFQRKINSYCLSIGRLSRTFRIFPGESLSGFVNYTLSGIGRVVKGQI